MLSASNVRGPQRVARLCARAASSARVLYGSQTGTAQQFAQQLGELLEGAGIKAAVEDLHEQRDASAVLADGRPAIWLVSCFGRGEPTDSAKPVMSSLAAVTRAPSPPPFAGAFAAARVYHSHRM